MGQGFFVIVVFVFQKATKKAPVVRRYALWADFATRAVQTYAVHLDSIANASGNFFRCWAKECYLVFQ